MNNPKSQDKILKEIEELEAKGLCAQCKGTGMIDSYPIDKLGMVTCLACSGTGKTNKARINEILEKKQ
jgi:DnaJ-class molecular chaperone